jgi:predicted Zn-dependent peptidase
VTTGYADFPLRTARLANGLRVVLHVDRRLPLVAVNLWYAVGSKHERPGRTGFAHLFEHMLFQGSEHVGTNDHFRHLQSIGGVANGSTWYDRTNYYETVPSHRLDLALWLESDRLGFLLPALDQVKLDTQREVVLNERRQRVDNRPYGRPFERLFVRLYPEDHPYHWPVIGWEEDIRGASLDEVRGFFRAWYSPANAVLTLAGDFEPEAALESVERWFGDLPGGAAPARRRWPIGPRAEPVAETVPDEVRLPRVYLAFRCPPFGEDDWYAGSLLAAVLADGKSSPLYRDLVWARQLAQDTGAYLYPTVESAPFVVWATARPGVEPTTLAAALREHLDRVAAEVRVEDHERARNRTLASIWAELETLDARADRLSMAATFFDRPEAAWEEPGRYLARTPAELAAFASRFLGARQAVELTVVPKRDAA